MSDVVITVTKKDGTEEAKIVRDCYIPEFITILIDLMRGNNFEKIVLTKQVRGSFDESED